MNSLLAYLSVFSVSTVMATVKQGLTGLGTSGKLAPTAKSEGWNNQTTMTEPVKSDKIPNDVNQPKTPAQYVRLFFTGVAMGSADIVPGVSGGTMAFILGVYEDLINAIKSFNVDLIRLVLKGDIRGAIDHIPWRFLIALRGGIGAAIVTLVTGLEFALHNYPIYLFSFFTGLIVASIIAVGVNVKWNVSSGIALVVAAVAAFFIVGLRPQDMAHTPLLLFISGAIAICAMILPGVSGSFLLLVLGQYEHVIGSVRGLIGFENVGANLVTVASVGIGCVVGIVIFCWWRRGRLIVQWGVPIS